MSSNEGQQRTSRTSSQGQTVKVTLKSTGRAIGIDRAQPPASKPFEALAHGPPRLIPGSWIRRPWRDARPCWRRSSDAVVSLLVAVPGTWAAQPRHHHEHVLKLL